MEQHLMEQLWAHIIVNNPEVMTHLKLENSVISYLEEKVSRVLPLAMGLISAGKPFYVIEELCLSEMTQDLRPSRFNYIWNILDNEFPATYQVFKQSGTRGHHTGQLLIYCKAELDRLGLSVENAYQDELYLTTIDQISQYLTGHNLLVDAGQISPL